MKPWLQLFVLVIALCTVKSTFAQPSPFQITHPQNGVTVIVDDTGNWGGASLGTSHQNQDQYWTRKTIDIPASALVGMTQARLRVFMALQDYSFANKSIKPNGLDESFHIIINDHTHTYKDSAPFLRGRANAAESLRWRWIDFDIPISELHAGKNSITFHKTHSANNDDYLYIGIDNSVSHGNSQLSLDGGKTWTDKQLNTIKASGEYMVRLLLLKESPRTFAIWTPDKITDPHHLIGYSGIETKDGKTFVNLQLDNYKIDSSQIFEVDYYNTPHCPDHYFAKLS